MRYFDCEIKHLDGYKFNNGERVKHLIDDDDEDDGLIFCGRFVRRASTFDRNNIYDPATMCSSFYDGVAFTDKRILGPRKYSEEEERESIRKFLNEPDDDDEWDD